MKIILAITILYVIPFIVVYLYIRKKSEDKTIIDVLVTIIPIVNITIAFYFIKDNWNFNWFFFKKP